MYFVAFANDFECGGKNFHKNLLFFLKALQETTILSSSCILLAPLELQLCIHK